MAINTYKLPDDKILLSSEIAYGDKTLEQLLNKIIPKVLYNNTSGTSGNVSLSETAANFEYIEIFYKSSDDDFNSVKIYQPNGKRAYLNGGWASETLYYKAKIVEISGTTINNSAAITETVIYNNKYPSVSKNNKILITRVLGYK